MDATTVKVSTKQISVFSDEYKKRRRQQMLRFFGVTVFTLVSARLAFRGVQVRKYVPNMFQLNHKQPSFSYPGEAASALAYGTGLATGSFAMLILGTCWMWDISSFPEFTMKVKRLMGEDESDASRITNMPMDDDTRKVVDALESLLSTEKKG